MKNMMNKVTALVLALVLVLSMSAAVLADEETEIIAETSVEEIIETVEEIEVIEETETVEEIEVIEETETVEEIEEAEIETVEEIAEGTVEEAEIIEQISEETVETVVEEKVITGTVSVFACYNDEMTEGDCVTLISEISGLEGCTVSYQWQRDAGNGFEDIAGANGSSYSFAATEETLSCGYRLAVSAN